MFDIYLSPNVLGEKVKVLLYRGVFGDFFDVLDQRKTVDIEMFFDGGEEKLLLGWCWEEGEEFGTEIDRGWIAGRLIGCV